MAAFSLWQSPWLHLLWVALIVLASLLLFAPRRPRGGSSRPRASTNTNHGTGTQSIRPISVECNLLFTHGGVSAGAGSPRTRVLANNCYSPISFGSATAAPGANGAPRGPAGYDEAA